MTIATKKDLTKALKSQVWYLTEEAIKKVHAGKSKVQVINTKNRGLDTPVYSYVSNFAEKWLRTHKQALQPIYENNSLVGFALLNPVNIDNLAEAAAEEIAETVSEYKDVKLDMKEYKKNFNFIIEKKGK